MKKILFCILILLVLPGRTEARKIKKEFNVYLGTGYFANPDNSREMQKSGTYDFAEIRFLPFRLKKLQIGGFVNGSKCDYSFNGYNGAGNTISFGPSFSLQKKLFGLGSYSWLNSGYMITEESGGAQGYVKTFNASGLSFSGGIVFVDLKMFDRELSWFNQYKFFFMSSFPKKTTIEETMWDGEKVFSNKNKASFSLELQTHIFSKQLLGMRFDPYIKGVYGQDGYDLNPNYLKFGIGFELLRIYNQPLLSAGYSRKISLGSSKALNIFSIELNATEVARYTILKLKQNKIKKQEEKL